MVKRPDGCEMKPERKWKAWSSDDARNYIKVPHESDDKYSRGVLGIIAGSEEYPGSAVLACGAALQTGIGMVRYFGTEKSQMLVLQRHPEVVIQAGKVQAWVIGPGLDFQKLDSLRISLIKKAFIQKIPILIDAGALSFINDSTDYSASSMVITPHYRELSRLLAAHQIEASAQEIEKSPKEWALFAAKKWGICVLLKGTRTLVATEETLLELPPATPWLASAGTGDVLAGIIGALIATQSDQISKDQATLASIVATGALVHSLAANQATERGPITASRLIEEIPSVVNSLIG